MNLATRCAACGTVFRVVTDQLRVSEGWVRCGRCEAVFNAAQTLFDIEAGTPVHIEGLTPDAALPADNAAGQRTAAPLSPAASMAAPPADQPRPGQRPAAAADDPLADVVPADWQQHQQRQALARRIASNDIAGALLRPATPAPADDSGGDAFAGADADAVIRHQVRRPAPVSAAATAKGWRAATHMLATLAGRIRHSLLLRWRRRAAAVHDLAGAKAGVGTSLQAPEVAAAAPDIAPSFLRKAERAAFWRRPMLRAGMLLACALLSATLLLQLALLWRDPLAAHVPMLASALRGLCQRAGCQVQALRRIDQISVDSSGLNRVDNSPYYRFSVLVRNRADTALLAPALDLSLTDNLGALVARRVLRLDELGWQRDQLERGQELPIQVLLAAGDRPVTGYTLELFYP